MNTNTIIADSENDVEIDAVLAPKSDVIAIDGQGMPPQSVPARQSVIRRAFGRVVRATRFAFEIFSLVTLLAVMTALPLIQLIAFGYLLDVAGKLASGAAVGQAIRWRAVAGRIGMAVFALALLGLPIRLLTHYAAVADVVSPGTQDVGWLRLGAVALTILAMVHLSWAWARGGRLAHYLWPAPLLWLSRFWRPSTWLSAADRLIAMIRSLEIPRLFWLGARGAIGTLIWLLPGTVIIAANRNGTTGFAGLIGAIAFVCMGIALLYLPMLQANFAAENRFSAIFAVRQVRRDFRVAPWAWFGAMFLTLVLLPIPLYLLKIEPPPPELIWLPTWFFIALMLPARVASGLALRRARSKPEGTSFWAFSSRWIVRLLMPAVVGVYLLFVYLSQYVSWDGLQTWVQQHAVLVPVPFVGG